MLILTRVGLRVREATNIVGRTACDGLSFRHDRPKVKLYAFKTHIVDYDAWFGYSLITMVEGVVMPRAAVEANERMNLRVPALQKAKLMRAAALAHTDLTEFVTRAALREAETVIEGAEKIEVSERDFVRILELMDNPPPPNDKLRAAIAALPRDR